MKIQCDVSVGEVLDKYSILLIKAEKIKDKEKLKDVNNEREYLKTIIMELPDYSDHLKQLTNVNKRLWEVEDELRKMESSRTFDNVFIDLARSVYSLNDERFRLKNNINIAYGSAIKEVKEYVKYK